MQRDIGRLTARTFDVLVVGGGIYGLTIAYDAALRGLAVALIDRSDFGGGSSFNHARTIHGGLRYLQSFDLARARESVRERRTIARIAPQTLRALPFAIALSRSLLAGKTAMHAGLLVDRLVASDRNRGVPEHLRLPPGRVLSHDEAIHRFPGLRRPGMTGAALWHDYIADEADRLTLAWAASAAARGATLANYVEAVALQVDRQRVTGVRAVDRLSATEIEVAATLTVNATGPALDRLLEPLGIATNLPLLKAMNLVTRREAGEAALGGRSAAGRHLFLIPWRGRALFGTWESATRAGPSDGTAREQEVAAFVSDLNEAFPSLDLRLPDVALVHRGIVPAVLGANGSVGLEGREQVRDHARDQGIEGLLSVAGAKYTTARLVAERVTDRIVASLGRRVPCRTEEIPLAGALAADVTLTIADARRDHDGEVPSDSLPHLVAAYGSEYRQVLSVAATRPEWRERVSPDSPVIGAELVWAVRREMAVTLGDAMIRRTPLGALGHPGDEAVGRAARIVGDELGWDDRQRREQIASVRSFYRIE